MLLPAVLVWRETHLSMTEVLNGVAREDGVLPFVARLLHEFVLTV